MFILVVGIQELLQQGRVGGGGVRREDIVRDVVGYLITTAVTPYLLSLASALENHKAAFCSQKPESLTVADVSTSLTELYIFTKLGFYLWELFKCWKFYF